MANPSQSSAKMVADHAEKAGDFIGPYKLIEELGEGGMGTVWLAEQKAPVRRFIALKVIKLGMDTRTVVARFEAERQVLAMLDHQNIAKVLDAGATATGRPFFAMELVRGVPFVNYCNEEMLPLRSRLALFIRVCQAIQHAHQKGVIHRDVKPSNILVMVEDGTPVPKVIDFGIAKATNQLSADPALTAPGHFIGTPAYMSPEQAEGSLDIDTRCDVYSLGVVLYELLTDQTPFSWERLRREPPDEMFRIMREEEPLRPSQRLRVMSEQAPTDWRHPEKPGVLANLVRNDLDWIATRCLAKDRTLRYDTAADLASDIQRFLDNKPVQAGPPTTLYILSKFARRHRLLLGVVGSFMLLAAVTGALLVQQSRSTWKRNQITILNQRIELESALQARSVAGFLEDDIISRLFPPDAGPGQGRAGPSVPLGIVLEDAEGNLSIAFEKYPLLEASIRNQLGRALQATGKHSEAVHQFERVLELRRRASGETAPGVVAVLNLLGSAYGDAGRPENGLGALQQALALEQNATNSAFSPALVADTQRRLAAIYNSLGRFQESVGLLNTLLEGWSKSAGRDDPLALDILQDLADAALAGGQLSIAESACREACEIQQGARPARPASVGSSLAALGYCLLRQQKYQEAEESLKTACDLLKDEAPSLCQAAQARFLLGEAFFGQKKYPQAETALLAAYNGFMQCGNQSSLRIKAGSQGEAAVKLMELYTEQGDSTRAAVWQERAKAAR